MAKRVKHESEQPVTAFDVEAEKGKERFLGRIRGKKAPRMLTVQELGGPEPRPLIAGRFAGPDLSLEAFLAGQNGRDIIPGSDAAVAQWRANQPRETFPGVVESP